MLNVSRTYPYDWKVWIAAYEQQHPTMLSCLSHSPLSAPVTHSDAPDPASPGTHPSD